jgi:hypothetical protein
MSLFGKRDQYSDAPKFSVDSVTSQTGQQQFGNTVFGADSTEVGVNHKIGHSGWIKITTGSGGRADRTFYEVLVAGGITGDATDFANTSSANVANTTGTADDTPLPDA